MFKKKSKRKQLYSPVDRSYKYSPIWMPLFYLSVTILIIFSILSFVYVYLVFNVNDVNTIMGFSISISSLTALLLCLIWIAINITNTPIILPEIGFKPEVIKKQKMQKQLAIVLKLSLFIVVMSAITLMLISGYTYKNKKIDLTEILAITNATLTFIFMVIALFSWFYFIKLKLIIIKEFQPKKTISNKKTKKNS